MNKINTILLLVIAIGGLFAGSLLYFASTPRTIEAAQFASNVLPAHQTVSLGPPNPEPTECPAPKSLDLLRCHGYSHDANATVCQSEAIAGCNDACDRAADSELLPGSDSSTQCGVYCTSTGMNCYGSVSAFTVTTCEQGYHNVGETCAADASVQMLCTCIE